MRCSKIKKKLAFLRFFKETLADMQKTNKLCESQKVNKVKLLVDLILMFRKLVLLNIKVDTISCTIDDYLNPRLFFLYLFE